MTAPAKSDRFTGRALAAGVLAVACCAGTPLAAGAVAAIGGLAFGVIAAAVILVLVGGLLLIRRRHHESAPPLSKR